MYKYLGFLLLLICAFTGTECLKEPNNLIETKFKTDTLYVSTHDTIVQQITDTITLTSFLEDTVTTLILVRHAETTGVGSNPPLSVAGQARATELARVLKGVSLQGVYATNYVRTMATAQVSASDQSLPVLLYDPLSPDAFADNLLMDYHGKAVLVVGHSNTIPTLLNTLTGTNDYSIIPDTEYDNLYLVTVFKKGLAKVVHLKYGM